MSAYGKTAAISDAQSAFRTTDIWPFNADIFEYFLFAPTEIFLKPIQKPAIQDHVRKSLAVPLHLLGLNTVEKQRSQAHKKKTPI
jgi:hypothetical protein